MEDYDDSAPTVFSGVRMDDMQKLISMIKGYERTLGPRGGFGNWRSELRTYITEVSGQIKENFNTHSANGAPFAPAQLRSAMRRTNEARRGDLNAMIDEGFPVSAESAEIRRPKPDVSKRRGDPFGGASARGWRGLRDIASNTSPGKYPGISLYKLSQQSVTIGVRSGDDAVPYAHSLLSSWGSRPGRNYMALSTEVTEDYLRELVEDGIRARLAGYRDYRGSFNSRGDNGE